MMAAVGTGHEERASDPLAAPDIGTEGTAARWYANSVVRSMEQMAPNRSLRTFFRIGEITLMISPKLQKTCGELVGHVRFELTTPAPHVVRYRLR